MCKKIDYDYRAPDKADVTAWKQATRIKIWQLIAENNSQVLTDPLACAPDDVIPYIRAGGENAASPPFKDPSPHLDDIMPLPAKKVGVKELLSTDPPSAPIATPKEKNGEDHKAISAPPQKQEVVKEPVVPTQKRRLADVFAAHFEWRHLRAERRDYFAALEVQIKNKNEPLYKLLKFLDEE